MNVHQTKHLGILTLYTSSFIFSVLINLLNNACKINSLSNLPIVYTVLFLGLHLVILCFIQTLFEGLNHSIE